MTSRKNLDCWDLIEQKSEQITFLFSDLPKGRLIWSPSAGIQAQGSCPSSAPNALLSGSSPSCLCTTPKFAIHFFFLQSASWRLSNCLSFIVNDCKKQTERKTKKEKEKKKNPQCYNLVLSVNQTFPVMLIACVSLMYFILLKSFETLQLSSYRPLCGYH